MELLQIYFIITITSVLHTVTAFSRNNFMFFFVFFFPLEFHRFVKFRTEKKSYGVELFNILLVRNIPVFE